MDVSSPLPSKSRNPKTGPSNLELGWLRIRNPNTNSREQVAAGNLRWRFDPLRFDVRSEMKHLKINNPIFVVLGTIAIVGIISNAAEQFLQAGLVWPGFVLGSYVIVGLLFFFSYLYFDEPLWERYKKDYLVGIELFRDIAIPTKNPIQFLFTLLFPAFLLLSFFPSNIWHLSMT